MRLLSLLLIFLVGLVSGRADVRLVGTDLLGEDFIAAFKDYARRNEIALNLSFTGTRLGMERLAKGEADLGIAVFAPNETKPSGDYVVLPVAYKTAVAVVPATLPLGQISYAQLAAIFGDDDQSTIKRWGDLGVVGEWASRSILPVISSPGNGITHDLFRYTVLKAPKLRPAVMVEAKIAGVVQRLKAEAGGIAILAALPPDEPALKALLVAKGSDDVAYGATPDNLHSGDYPLRLPVYLVFKKASRKQLQSLLRFLLSEEAIPLWEKAEMVSLPVQVRNQQIFDLEVP